MTREICIHCGKSAQSAIHDVASPVGEIRNVAHAFVLKPTIVCLCGSSRFYSQFQKANYEETMAGRIILSVGFYPDAQEEAHGGDVGVTPEQKVVLEELHKRKIDLADEVLILNVGGYIGASTRSEIEYAKQRGKTLRWLESPPENW